MLGKLLKYDLRAIFKYWWIVALSSLGLSFVGGFSIRLLISSTVTEELPFVAIFATLGIVVTVIGLSAFFIATEIFVYVRFYQNLFSDEGYLTFTLPVRRRDILNSKIISGLFINLITSALLICEVALILIIGLDQHTLYVISESIIMFISGAFDVMGAWSAVFIIEAILALFLLSIATYLLTLICITFAAVIAKKHKVFAAIGIYYVVTALISFIGQMGVMFGSICLAGILETIPEGASLAVISLIVLSLVLCAGAIAAALYSIEHYLLDRKLNLS